MLLVFGLLKGPIINSNYIAYISVSVMCSSPTVCYTKLSKPKLSTSCVIFGQYASLGTRHIILDSLANIFPLGLQKARPRAFGGLAPRPKVALGRLFTRVPTGGPRRLRVLAAGLEVIAEVGRVVFETRRLRRQFLFLRLFFVVASFRTNYAFNGGKLSKFLNMQCESHFQACY